MASVLSSVRDSMSGEEWQARCELAACYRLFVKYGWTDLIFTHLTVRVPGNADQYLINPYGLMFTEILMTIQMDHGAPSTGQKMFIKNTVTLPYGRPQGKRLSADVTAFATQAKTAFISKICSPPHIKACR